RSISERLEITFRDERNAIVKFEGKQYSATLVDLPTITESYRTVDKKQLLKTADICQMLVIEKEVADSEIPQLPRARGLDTVHPDGLAPPLTNVRKQRFRKRMPSTKVDAIEREVLRLLEEDAQAMSIKFEIYDEQGEDGRAGTPSVDIIVANDDMEFDENLAAELAQGLEELDDDDEDDDDDDESEEEDQPNNERAMQMKLLGEEIAELERTIKKKGADLDSAPNPIIRRRFEDIIQRLHQEMDAKKVQLEAYSKEAEENEEDSKD
ncbi:hypothetical protein DL89DRAFT_220592, partial [Linderina pennispora]